MPLPTLKTPKYELTIPSSQVKVKFRPFLVKEEKILLMAAEGSDPSTMITALQEICGACIEQKNFDILSLPTFDLEYIFLQLRSKSVGEMVDASSRCTKCDGVVPFEFDISEVSVIFPEDHTDKIELSKEIGLNMRYPTWSMATDLSGVDTDSVDNIFKILTWCIEKIYDKDTVYDRTDYTDSEFEDFVMSLTQPDLTKIRSFFDTMPYIEKKLVTKCPKCEHEDTRILRRMEDFFT